MYWRDYTVGFAAIIAGVTASTCAQASTVRAGSAITVVRDVSGSVSGTSWEKKVEGDDVYENELVRTAARSSAVISFVDETKISIGQAATMKIDRVVLKSNRSVEELIVSAEAGAMRWNSGTSPSSAYQVKTPEAIIRPLGTIFDLLVESQRTMVVLRSGTIEVCSVGAPQRCRTLSQPGEMIIATPSDLEGPRRGGLGPSEFADRCLSADAMPCLITASVSPARPTKSGSIPAELSAPRPSEAEKKRAETEEAEMKRRAEYAEAARKRPEAKEAPIEDKKSPSPQLLLPEFPWPPPTASSSYVLPDNLFESRRTVGAVVAAIISALERNGYVERSFFRTEPGGIALVTRLERIKDDGSSFAEGERWPPSKRNYASTDDLARFLYGLFFVDPGHYRVIVFILQDLPFSQSSKKITGEEARRWLSIGANILPPEISERPFGNGHCTVLIYEFSSDGTTVRVVESRLTGKQHLEKAGVLSLLEKVN